MIDFQTSNALLTFLLLFVQAKGRLTFDDLDNLTWDELWGESGTPEWDADNDTPPEWDADYDMDGY